MVYFNPVHGTGQKFWGVLCEPFLVVSLAQAEQFQDAKFSKAQYSAMICEVMDQLSLLSKWEKGEVPHSCNC